MDNTSYIIKYVALYLRKSRGEEDIDLEKHRFILREMCVKHGWKYVEYVEIANSETIEYRPKFKSLLSDVEEGIYDAVLVVDYQRLGRGELEDQGKIKRIFRDSETYIVTPEKIYNLVDDTDDLLVDVRGLLARQEYKTTTKNLQRGKKIGARLGKWTNGPAPFPYVYTAAIKGLEVVPERNVIYQEMKSRVLGGESLEAIGWDFNRRGIPGPGPKKGLWHSNTIGRILISEVHLGKIISNKTKGSGHKKKKTQPLVINPREEWVVVENCHAAVKTEEEHMKLLAMLEKNQVVPNRAKAGTYALSGLVFCGKCKKMMRYNVRSDGYTTNSIKACNKYDHFGNYCTNSGVKVNILTDFIDREIIDYEQRIIDSDNYINTDVIEKLERIIREKEAQLTKLNRALSKIKEMYEMEEYTREEYEERKAKRQQEISALESELAVHRYEINYDSREKNKERMKLINSFKDIWSSESATEHDKNMIAKMIISRIEYIHDKGTNNLNISIQFN
ncbi:recombinase family protein [Paenibacillus polymyxa]|uniref:recombinase family protein n=1 Tax=Paenibacillus polymyxa TaxID=1406 RepID=UPI0007EBF76F|nr:recombinase family protein [Paenibacillus polymyxa]OAZ43318.1 hypothetical protein A9Z39_21990 [Paenibacillus polymyxa]